MSCCRALFTRFWIEAAGSRLFQLLSVTKATPALARLAKLSSKETPLTVTTCSTPEMSLVIFEIFAMTASVRSFDALSDEHKAYLNPKISCQPLHVARKPSHRSRPLHSLQMKT
jgi:hypothetical protein